MEHRITQALRAGFPKSLLRRDDDAVNLLAVMRKHHLTTERIKRFLSIPFVKKRREATARKEETFIKALSIQRFRADLFAWSIERKPGLLGSPGVSPESALLTELAPEWPTLNFDEAALDPECDGAWQDIRGHAQSTVNFGAPDSVFRVFMLWPALRRRFQQKEADSRWSLEQAGQLAFALSTISCSDWFVRRAVAWAPALAEDLGHLLADDPTPMTPELDNTDSGTDRPSADPELLWAEIGLQIARLHDEWPDAPARGALEKLSDLGREALRLLEALPDDEERPEDIYAKAVDALRERFTTLPVESAMSWFGAEESAQLLARWELARLQAESHDALVALAADATAALERLSLAVQERQAAEETLEKAAQVEADLAEEIESTRAGISQLRLKQRHIVATETLVAAQRLHNDAISSVLSAASPRGETYDLSVDYAAQARGPADASPATDVPLPPQAAGPAEGDPENPVALGAVSRTFDPSPALVSPDPPNPPATVAIHPEVPEPNLAAAASPRTSETSEPAEPSPVPRPMAAPFTPEAGTRCQPLWSLLRMGRPSLAYQWASVLQRNEPSLRVPAPELIRAVALASGVTTSDGRVAMELRDTYADIDAAWFKGADAPSNWGTALNLLLVAATLRPMVLAAATGASAIASYRNLDGRHEALLRLVHKVADTSKPMVNFSIDPTVLHSAANEAALERQLKDLSLAAGTWLRERAPNRRNKYAPASRVWQQWLKPGEPIHELIAPVAANEIRSRQKLKLAINELSDHDAFLLRVADTDRKRLERRGPDIIAGALEQLWASTNEAIAIARGWLTAANMLSDSDGPLPALVAKLRVVFDTHATEVCEELGRGWPEDRWGQVEAASQVLISEIEAIRSMFRGDAAAAQSDRAPREVLARDLLLVPDVRLDDHWTVGTPDSVLEARITTWSAAPLDALQALDARLSLGDVAGARKLLAQIDATHEHDRLLVIERAREQWGRDLRVAVLKCRRDAEVGLAFGYLSDEERAACESELSAIESGEAETERFDTAMEAIIQIGTRIEECRKRRIASSREDFERERPSLSPEDALQVEAPLLREDIHTFNELMQRVRAGEAPWPELEQRRDLFKEFYPGLQESILSDLEQLKVQDIARRIREGGQIGEVSFDLDGDDLARKLAAEVFEDWCAAGSRGVQPAGLRKILGAIGIPVQEVTLAPGVPRGTQAWALRTRPIEDREICPVPFFGSRAQGRYRVVSIRNKMTAEDLLRDLGEEAHQTPTIALVFSRSPRALWSSLARVTKEKQRPCMILDESLLLFLLSRPGQRLATWFSVALPFGYSEPYDASAGAVPPEMFYGRSEELRRVKEAGGCYFIYGGRQLGKTALMRRAERSFHDPDQDRYAVWVDLVAQGIGERRPAADVWTAIFEKLRDLRIPELVLPSVNAAKPSTVDAMLASIKTFLDAKSGRRILLLLDEADRFFELDSRSSNGSYPETRRIKQLMDETERRFKVVFAGLHNVLRTASTSNQPLGHLGEAVQIGPLMSQREIRSAEELITRPIEAAGYEFSDRSLVMRVLAQTNYYPSLIQLYCTQLLRHLRDTKLQRRDASLPRFKINESDIESVFSGRALREAIRLKFRLTLQLDDRYEVIANAIGLEALDPAFDHSEGLGWRQIRRDCLTWWPEGFRSTPERDFLALLEEMEHLGVLRASRPGELFTLRNPNVLLLLGSKQEIESTLEVERQPGVVFESTIFHPTLMDRANDPARNPLTYRQLDDVMQTSSSVWLIAASDAAGGQHLVSGIQGQRGMVGRCDVVVMPAVEDCRSFRKELDRAASQRSAEGITLLLVKATQPWDLEWISTARRKIGALTSQRKTFSIVFLADPAKLWTFSSNGEVATPEPWLSVLPWDRPFVRKWLEEQQLPTDALERLHSVTGYWGGLLESLARASASTLDFAGDVEKLVSGTRDPAWCQHTLGLLTGGVSEAMEVLAALARLDDGVTADDIVEYESLQDDSVRRTLRWAEQLGLVSRSQGDAWALDPFTKSLLGGSAG